MSKKPEQIESKDLLLRVRRWQRDVKTEGQPYADIWLIQRDGTAESCLQWGQVPIGVADLLADWFARQGVATELTERVFAWDEDSGLNQDGSQDSPPGEDDSKANKPYECSHCGKRFSALRKGLIETHNYPKPCRAVCPGSGKEPKEITKGETL